MTAAQPAEIPELCLKTHSTSPLEPFTSFYNVHFDQTHLVLDHYCCQLFAVVRDIFCTEKKPQDYGIGENLILAWFIYFVR